MADTRELIDHLQGTCLSLEQACEDLGLEVDDVDTDLLDGEVFLCAQCGWWCEACEANEGPDGEDVCDDCHEDGD